MTDDPHAQEPEPIPPADGPPVEDGEQQPEQDPEQTDNRPRDEDGEQDVNQDPSPCEGSV